MNDKPKYNPQIHHRRSIRLKGYDYSQAGLYFITICIHNRECLFGEITSGEMMLNEMGNIAYNEWMKTPELRPNIELDVFIVMPNHIHGIIKINEIGGRGVLHTPINNDTTQSNKPNDIQGEFNSPIRSPSQTIGSIVRGYKSSVTKKINALHDCPDCSVWQRNYHEHIIRNEQSYQTISNYIINNPAKWEEDKFYMKLIVGAN